MQPYFFPYLGYYQLFASVDAFVVFDNAQFPRRGRVHRSEFFGPSGNGWLTLPVCPSSRETPISRVNLADDASKILTQRMAALDIGLLGLLKNPSLREILIPRDRSLLQYLRTQLAFMASLIAPGCQLLTASEVMERPVDVDFVEYIIRIGEELSADVYVNASGGAALYPAERFEARGLELKVLDTFEGPRTGVLQLLAHGSFESEAHQWLGLESNVLPFSCEESDLRGIENQ